MKRRTVRISIVSGFIALALLSGCALLFPSPPAPPNQPAASDKGFVGQLSERDALLALLIEDGEALAYVCDGVEGRASISGWFEGGVVDGQLVMVPLAGTTYETTMLGATITASVRPDAVEGLLTLEDGTELAFLARPAEADKAAGLYVHLDDEALTSVVVDNDNELKGLSRLRVEGWTSRVVPAAPLTRANSIDVLFNNRNAFPVQLRIPVQRQIPIVRPVVRPQSDPLPTVGNGTYMILANVNAVGIVRGAGYIVERPDPIGAPTVKLTQVLRDPARLAQRQGYMRVQVIAESGAVLSGQYIDDPLNEFVEVHDSERGDAPFVWIRGERVQNFLVAVPNVPRSRRVVFTRFDASGRPLGAGAVDLLAKAGADRLRQQVTTTNYDLNAVEYATVQDNGPPQDRIDLLILAEGYQNTNAHRQAFQQAVSNTLQYLWSIPIYAEYQQKINVHTAFLPSVDAGSSRQGGPNPIDKDTVYQSFFDCNALDDCRALKLTPAGRQFAFEVAENSPGNYGGGSVDVLLVLVNDPARAGTAMGKICTVSAHPDGPQIAAHELGHSAIGLADEYESIYNDLAVSQAQQKVNVSAPVSNRNDLKWISLVHPSTSIPTQNDPGTCIRAQPGDCTPSTLPAGTVGMYEGAGYAACGSYRPTTSCVMRCSPTGLFCEVCRQAFRDTLGDPFGDFVAPVEDVYMRDNSLDSGATPSPANVVDPTTGVSVRPWQSVDIGIDAPPFGNLTEDNPHENPIAGVTNHVHVTVHNRGNLDSQTTTVVLWWAPATGGAPPFPGAWTQVGVQIISVPGGNSSTTAVFEWNVPADAPPHTCMVAGATSPNKALPSFNDTLTGLVRNNNNMTWRNLHVVNIPEIEGNFSNFERAEETPTVVRIWAGTVPVGTQFELTYQTNITLSPYDVGDPGRMLVNSIVPGQVTFERVSQVQSFLTLQTNMPSGAPSNPFVSTYTLRVRLPGGSIGSHTISVDQLELLPNGLTGEWIGGNTYIVSLN